MNKTISETPFVDSHSFFAFEAGKGIGESYGMKYKDAAKLERLLNRIAVSVDKLSDSPQSLLVTMQEFSKNWKEDRNGYLG